MFETMGIGPRAVLILSSIIRLRFVINLLFLRIYDVLKIERCNRRVLWNPVLISYGRITKGLMTRS